MGVMCLAVLLFVCLFVNINKGLDSLLVVLTGNLRLVGKGTSICSDL